MKWLAVAAVLLVPACFVTLNLLQADPPLPPAVGAAAAPPANAGATLEPAVKIAESKITAVTVYQNSALVTREVVVPDRAGTFEVVVSPLPPQTIDSSLFSEGTDGIHVLSTRYRTRPIREDVREEVRKAEAQLKEFQLAAQKLQSQIQATQQNLQMLSKLENFTGATLQQMTEKGQLLADNSIQLAKYVMEQRASLSQQLVQLQQQLQDNQEQTQFIQRQLNDLSAGPSRTERDAVIIVQKAGGGPGKVYLNYLVNSVTWRPHYKFRAGKDKEPVLVEYLAAVRQQTGEDWGDVNLCLSTAQPMLNAAPPDLAALEVAVFRGGVPPGTGQAGLPPQPMPTGPGQAPNPSLRGDFDRQSRDLRQKAQQEFVMNKKDVASRYANEAAAIEQTWALLCAPEHEIKKGGQLENNEGPSVTFKLKPKYTIPSRQDEQVVEVDRLELTPDYYYKAVPVLTRHVYRLATLTNKSQYDLLPGEATMYIGTDFVGRTELPLIAVGEEMTLGFGVDPQIKVQRQMVDKVRTLQGANQVLTFDYRITISSYKPEPVKLQVWDRLPYGEAEIVGINLVKTNPEISKDPLYVREDKPKNLLRWDVTVDPTMNGEKAFMVTYVFKMEFDRNAQIGGLQAR
jgi:hypothetical protein